MQRTAPHARAGVNEGSERGLALPHMWMAPINTAPECGIPHPLSPSRMTLRNTLPRADMTTGHGARLALPTTARRYETCLVRGCCVRRSQHGLVAARGDRPAKDSAHEQTSSGGHLGHARSHARGPFLEQSSARVRVGESCHWHWVLSRFHFAGRPRSPNHCSCAVLLQWQPPMRAMLELERAALYM